MKQRLPNPANPCATIVYELRARSHVTLIVIDPLGRRVATLVDEVEEAGDKSVSFNANGLASGQYYYQLSVMAKGSNGKSGSYVKTKKLLLLEQGIQERS
ncbi:MAG: hypothetical protein ABSF91_12840 [Bacteroidota bacterium]|jgi:hypothetical protein